MVAAAFGDAELVRLALEGDADVDARDAGQNTALIYVSAYGRPETMKVLLDASPDVEAKGAWERTALHVAAGHPGADPECLRLLLDAGADTDASDFVGHIPLVVAAGEGGDVARLQILIEDNAKHHEDNVARARLNRALIWACLSSRVDAVSVLLAAGASLDHTDRFWGRPLHAAAQSEDGAAIPVLVASGADLDSSRHSVEDGTPLMDAARSGSASAVEALIEAGAALDKVDAEGRTALMHASTALIRTTHGMVQPPEDVFARIDLLADAGADVEVRDKSGRTALIVCASDYSSVAGQARRLIAAGADVNAFDDPGGTALMYAVSLKHPDFISVLIDAGADVNARDKRGRTALTWAVGRDAAWMNPGPIHLLAEAGADIESRDDRGWTAVRHAMEANDYYAMASLTDLGADLSDLRCTDLHEAIWLRRTVEIERIVREGADLEARDARHHTPLMLACSLFSSDEIIRFLVRSGARRETTDLSGRTALMIASSHTLDGAVGALIELGADVHARDADGMTPLMYAATYEFGEFNIEKLVRAGADVNAQDELGHTALVHAIINIKPGPFPLERVRRLVLLGADPTIVNAQDKSAIDRVLEDERLKRTEELLEILGMPPSH